MKKYLIYLMMATAVVMFGACSPDEDHEPETPGIETPETPDDGENDTPENPDEPENPEEPGDSGCLFQLGRHNPTYGTGNRSSDRSRHLPH